MKELKYIVCSLELAKELKKNGYPQESLFYWADYGVVIHPDKDIRVLCEGGRIKNVEWFPAPTATELLNELPSEVDDTKLIEKSGVPVEWNYPASEPEYYPKLFIDKGESDYSVCYSTPHISNQQDESLPNALAKMYIYLKSEGLIDG